MAADHRRHHRRDAHDKHHQRQDAGSAVTSEYIADHRPRQHGPGTGAERLDETPGGEGMDATRQAATDGGDAIEQNAGSDGSPAAEAVGESAPGDLADAEAEKEGGKGPLHLVLRRIEA